MTYKQFVSWCNNRACDGYWSLNVANHCIAIMKYINAYPFWKREKIWKKELETTTLNMIIIPINKKIEELDKKVGSNNDTNSR